MIKKSYLFLTLLTAFLWLGSGTMRGDETLTLYGTSSTTYQYMPAYGSYLDENQHNQFIIPASDLTEMQGGTIKGLKFYLSTLGTWSSSGAAQPTVVVSVAEVDQTTLSSLNTTAELHEVYSGSFTFNSSTTPKEWYITFPSANYYTYGGKNLLVDIVTTAGGKYITTYWYVKSYSGGAYSYKSVRNYLPRTTFTYAPAAVSCQKPSDLKKTAASANSATFTWTKGDNESSWQYICLPAASTIDWSDANVQVATSTTATVSGLAAETDYKFYLRAFCSATDQSADVVKAFKTPCLDYATADLPYEKNFNDLTSGSYPDCWTKVAFVSGTTSYPVVYGSNGESGSKSLRFYGGVTGTSEQIAILPPFEEETGNLLLSFWYKNGNASTSYGQFTIGYITDPEDASTFKQVGNALTRNTSGAEVTKFALTGAPANSFIAIKYAGGSYSTSAYIDNIKVSLPSSCTDPSDVNAVAASATSATVSWTENGSATTWNLQYSTDNFATSTSVNGITENPYTLEGLTANTTYKVRVQADCGGEQSDWIASAAFPTPCEDQTGVGYEMNFNNVPYGSGSLPDCWQKNSSNNYPYVYNYYAKSGNCLYFYGGVTGSTEQIAILPPFSEKTNKLSIALYYNNASSWDDYSGANYGQLSIGYMTNPADASTFVAKETLAKVTTYTAAEVALVGAPDNAYIAIRYAGGSSTGAAFVDDIVISEVSSCLKPSSVNGSATAYDRASISWTENGSATAWQLRYSSDNGENWSAAIDVNENPYLLTGLSGNNNYLVQVQSVCGVSEYSGWSMASAAIPTPCQPVDASDYSENMENSAINIGNLPDCWQYREKYSSGYPYVYNYAYYAYAGNNSLYFYGGVDGSSEQSVLLPDMNQPLNGLTFEFYYKDAESAWSTLAKFTVGYIAADGTTFVPIETLNYADSYTKYTKDLSALPVDAKCLAIRFAGGESTAYGYIDNVRVYPTPNCLAPTAVTVSNVTANTADVAWTENNSATAWKIQLSNDGSTWGDAIDVNANPYQLTGLTPNKTTYYVRVKAVCGVGDESPYSEASDPFETECGSVALPFNEDFSGADLGCWTKEHCYSSTGLYNGTFRFFYNNTWASEVPPQYLISPEIDAEGKQVTIEFDYYMYSGTETFKVGYSTTTKEVSAFTWGAEQTATNTTALKYSENLPAGVKYVAIMHTSNDQYYLYIDNFSVAEYVAPACPAVSAATLQESNVTAHTATVSWTAGGEETAWNLQYKSAGAAEWSAVIPVATTPSYDLTGLAENTVYFVKVQADCAGDGTGDWTGDEAFSFPTDCDPKAVSKASPWNYGFEDAADDAFPACWDRNEVYANHGYPIVNEDSYNAKTGDKYLYFYTPARNGGPAYTEDAILPVFNTDIKNLKVSFVYKNNSTGTNYGQLAVGYVSGNEFVQVGDLLAKVDDYTSVEREMPNDAPDGARIAIRCIGGNKGSSYTTYIYVDDIVVSLKPTCHVPTALAAAETSDGAVLTWTAGKDENEWNVRYSVKDADTWTTINEIATNGYTLTGLSLDVTYEVQVRAYCGENDESEWSASAEFTPVCNAPSALTVTARTMTSATFSWISSESAWVLQYSVDGVNWESENIAANPYTLNNLAAGQTYQAKIKSACDSEFSNVVEFTTVCAMRSAAELPFSEDFTGIADYALPACWESATASVESEKLFFRGADEQIVVLPGYDVALNKLSVSFDYTLNNASMQFGYVETIGGEFHSLAELEGTAFEADLTTAPAMAGYLAFRYYNSLSQYAANTIDNVIVMDKSALALKDTEDNDAVLAQLEGQAVTITIQRTIFCDGYYNTLCLPFDMDEVALAASPLAGYAKLAKFCEATIDGGADELQLVYEYATSIEAGVPYLIKFPAGENIVNPTFTNVTISATAGSSVNLGNGINVKGILKPEPFTAGNENMLFLLGENKLAWAGVTNYLKGFRAYFQLTSTPANSPVRRGMNARIVERQNMPTGIEDVRGEVKSLKVLENNQVVIIRNGVKYSVQGQVISK